MIYFRWITPRQTSIWINVFHYFFISLVNIVVAVLGLAFSFQNTIDGTNYISLTATLNNPNDCDNVFISSQAVVILADSGVLAVSFAELNQLSFQ